MTTTTKMAVNLVRRAITLVFGFLLLGYVVYNAFFLEEYAKAAFEMTILILMDRRHEELKIEYAELKDKAYEEMVEEAEERDHAEA